MEILTGVERRRRWSSEEKLQIVQEAFAPGSSVGTVARRHDICRSQIYQWRREFRSGRLRSKSLAVVDFLPVEVCDEEDEPGPPNDTLSSSSGVLILIKLRHERTLRIPSDLPCDQIRRLIVAVEAA